MSDPLPRTVARELQFDNGPAIGDLMRLFDFDHQRADTSLLPY